MYKSKIRKKILKIRKEKYKKNINIKFKNIYNFLKKKINLKNKIIGGYYPVNYEIDDLNILKNFEKKNIIISFPSIKKNYRMNFIRCSLNDPFIVNKYGIPEPTKGRIVYPDILFVPLVAFDKKLNRIGYGAGYYDRIISNLKKRKKIISIGIAFDFQELKFIPISRHDQKLDYVITNKSILS